MSEPRYRFVCSGSMRHPSPVRAITLDLDDTLWPFAPVAQRIQAALEGWMVEHAPAASLSFDPTAARESLDTVRRERPDIAFAVIYEARQQVDHYEDRCTSAIAR
jgi:FMN phosphatase YigB (HAD superfamily)